MTGSTSRLPGLDGLRAIGVLLVVFHHLCSQGTFASSPSLAATLKHGSFGVQIFFVLSGFLITWLLLGEERRSGTIDLKRFYFRRSLRILPPAFFFLGVMAALTAIGLLSIGGLRRRRVSGGCALLEPGHRGAVLPDMAVLHAGSPGPDAPRGDDGADRGTCRLARRGRRALWRHGGGRGSASNRLPAGAVA
jgi:hypothetical protein